jgi:apolipoprotein N-acyltransferase
MEEVASSAVTIEPGWFSRTSSLVRVNWPTLTEWLTTASSSLLLIAAFPDFGLFPLAWIALVPLLFCVAKRPEPMRALILGCAFGTLFFYGSCYWLTYSMIHYGGLSRPLSFLLLLPPSLLVGIFPGLFAASLALTVRRWGLYSILSATVLWPASEWCRLEVTGQLWNAIGYSQAEAFSGLLIHSARWGGVYFVGALIVAVNASFALVLINRASPVIVAATLTLAVVVAIVVVPIATTRTSTLPPLGKPSLNVVAIQPNVPMSLLKTEAELKQLFGRHLELSSKALKDSSSTGVTNLVIWPESPMNFSYASDPEFRRDVSKFVDENHTSVLFNSLEPAPNDGAFNSALLINEHGQLIAQYDKIRLMPFGEYVPLPHWLPGSSLITGLVGDFTAGQHYITMPLADQHLGVFICIESAYPELARRFTSEGASVLVTISNDGYLGPTAVMRQHLANAIFRAVENDRPLLSVTNAGLTAFIQPDGNVLDRTNGFETAVRNWKLTGGNADLTFYTKHGDLFAQVTTVISILILVGTLFGRRRSYNSSRWTKI